MANNSHTAAGLQQGAVYNCEWGNVAVLDHENYSAFESTCRATLIAAGAWDIVQGTEVAPTDLTSNAGREWVTRRDRGLQIIFRSTSEGIRSELNPFRTNQDLPGMWNHLVTYNQAKDPFFVAGLLKRFHADRYKPPNDTINAFATRLRKVQDALAGTENAISDKHLHMQLVTGLPDTSKWEIASQFAINQFTKFAEAVRYLRSVEATQEKSPEASNANANTANTDRGNQRRGSWRGRGRSRGRSRGRGYSRSRGRDQHSGSKSISSSQCAWCLKEGHWQKDCREYKKAKDAAQRAAAKKNSNN